MIIDPNRFSQNPSDLEFLRSSRWVGKNDSKFFSPIWRPTNQHELLGHVIIAHVFISDKALNHLEFYSQDQSKPNMRIFANLHLINNIISQEIIPTIYHLSTEESISKEFEEQANNQPY